MDQMKMFQPPEQEPDDSIPEIKPIDAQQPFLIETGEWWENHWKGMPEYKSEDLMPFKTIYVHFETRENMDKFAKFIDQNITLDTQSIWYPEMEMQHLMNKKYKDTK